MDTHNDERLFWLEVEKRLSQLHKDLWAERRRIEHIAPEAVLMALEGAQWKLGAAILEANHAAAAVPASMA
jgi:hypothetical protein